MTPIPDLSIIVRALANDADADQALHVLAWMAARQQELRAQLDQAMAALEAALQQDCRLEVEGETFAFADVTAALESSLRDYAAAHRERLFQKAKTHAFAHGEIRLRKQADRLALAEGETAESVLPRISHDERLVKRKVEIDLAAIRSLRSKGLVTDDQLADWGLVYVQGTDQVVISV